MVEPVANAMIEAILSNLMGFWISSGEKGSFFHISIENLVFLPGSITLLHGDLVSMAPAAMVLMG